MKTFIIFTPEITNMGGAQMYTANKVRYMVKNGWDVQVFFAKQKGEILIPELKEYKDNLILELGIPLRFLTKSMKKSVFLRVEEVCKGSEEIVLESQIITTSFFIEEVASYLGARHIINSLDERIPISYKEQYKFFEFKLRRWEFQNASEKRLKQTFGEHYKEEFLAFENTMVYKCSNVLSEDPIQFNFAESNYTILSIGRLDKPYIMPMTEEIKLFALKHREKTINVIYIGGSYSGEYEGLIQQVMEPLQNIKLYMMGYTYPVPTTIIDLADVAIASANSVNVSADQDLPTIVVDIHDSMAIGVYGYDTTNKFSRVKEPQDTISSYLDRVLVEGKYPRKGIKKNSMNNSNKAFERELSFIEKSKGNIGYYDVESLVPLKLRLLSRLVWWKYQIFEPDRLDPRKRKTNK